MAQDKGKVTLGAGTFPAGAKVGLHYRIGDFPSQGNVGDPIDTVSVGDDGTAEFSGLEPGASYYVVSQGKDQPFRAVAVTAKEPQSKQSAPGAPPEKVREQLKSQAQAHADLTAPPVVGMRSTATAKPQKAAVAEGRDSLATPTATPEANKQTAESALETDKALAKQDPAELDSVDEGAHDLALEAASNEPTKQAKKPAAKK